jgi:hypothetical protein
MASDLTIPSHGWEILFRNSWNEYTDLHEVNSEERLLSEITLRRARQPAAQNGNYPWEDDTMRPNVMGL